MDSLSLRYETAPPGHASVSSDVNASPLEQARTRRDLAWKEVRRMARGSLAAKRAGDGDRRIRIRNSLRWSIGVWRNWRAEVEMLAHGEAR